MLEVEKRWLHWEAEAFHNLEQTLARIERKLDMNTEAQTKLAAAVSAIAVAVSDVGKGLANLPAAQADDSKDIIAAADNLTGFATQLESFATTLAHDASGATGPAPTPAAPGTVASSSSSSGGSAPATTSAPEAGSAAGPGTAELTPAS